jgi:hypothetical protein
VRAITVRQPLAWAIIHGGKDVENRTRNLAGSYRGQVAIHAAKAIADRSGWTDPNILAVMLVHDDLPDWSTTLGHIIGVADLVDVHLADSLGCPDLPPSLTEAHSLCSPWAMRDHWHLVLANPRPLAAPIPWRGALGLWTLPDDFATANA